MTRKDLIALVSKSADLEESEQERTRPPRGRSEAEVNESRDVEDWFAESRQLSASNSPTPLHYKGKTIAVV